MSFQTASAILRGGWLLQESYAQQHLPLVLKMIDGENVDFGLKKDESPEALVLSHNASVYDVNYYTDLSKLPEGSVAVLNIIGPVTKYGDYCSYGAKDHAATMNRLANSPNISGIILNIDSPGGQVNGTPLLADAIKEVSRRKPVVAVIDDGIAASAAMWIASAANEIYTTKKSDKVGSIGVYTTLADWYGYAAKQGLKIRDIYAPQSTDKNGDYREAIAGNEEPIKEDLAAIANNFITTIKENRAGKIVGDAWATGKMYYAKEAQKLGLIDGIKSFDQVVKRISQMVSDKQQQNKTYNMAFENTLVAAGAESFAVVDGGFLLTEENLNAIESTLLEAAQNVFSANAAVATAHEEKQTITEALAATTTLAGEQAETITTLQARITELENAPAGSFASTAKDKDDIGGSGNKVKSPVDAEADRLRAMRNQ